MSFQDLSQPDTTSDGRTSARWMALLWRALQSIYPGSSVVITAGQVFGNHSPVALPLTSTVPDAQLQNAVRIFQPHTPAPLQPNQLAPDSQLQNANRAFLPHVPSPTQPNLIVADSSMQIGIEAFQKHVPTPVTITTTSDQGVLINEVFLPRPIPQYLNFNAVDSTTILAGQIFGA